LIATTIMLLIASGVATLATAVHSTNDFCRGYTTCGQHARVALSHIERAMSGATTSEAFPGCMVVTEQFGTQALPATLVVWFPTTAAANPAALPLISEIVVFSPDPARPNTLLEIRSPTDSSTAPAATDSSGWHTLIDRLKTSPTTTKIVLTDRLRTSPASGSFSDSLSASDLRGNIRFRRLITPSDAEWNQYRAGTRTWQNISWPLDSYRSTSGTRTVVCQTELQLVPGAQASSAVTSIPFFGSASISYELAR
jgi:hypothetical protein